ncbi:dehydrogenase [Segetibacter sp. 3557_3]|nr:dehydrogenase [Segetibacter sp. 3557_3]
MIAKRIFIWFICLFSVCFIGATWKIADAPRRLEILFLGHKSKHHDSQLLADILNKEYFKDGINITYTNDPNDMNDAYLKHFDGLVLYANHDQITKDQEKALLGFVRGGKGFIPLHSASYCFRNSPEVVEMIGGQFANHKTDSFPAVVVKPDHPVMKGINAFTTWDETYVHTKISKNIEVLSERVEGDHHEPYTWVRPFGDGRVFYTAYGHNEKTFNNPGFLNLVKNGILWAVGEKASANLAAYKIAQPSYSEAQIPNYENRNPAPKLQAALTPEQSMSLMQVPPGFELQLFASEPDIVNPVFMNWDERGRLWVIETVDYPNEVKEGDVGDDRIKILEDTNGDGKADKFTVFADKLNIPTSFAFVNGGIVVSIAPSFLFLKDTNGDDKADIRQPVISGWGKSDTHAQASNLRYGVDNKIWGVVGYSGFNGKVGDSTMRFSSGVYRFTPDGKKLEYLSNTSNNTWGLGFSEDFDVFISTANNTHTAFYGMDRKYLAMAKIDESGVEKLDAHYEMHVATKNLRQVDVFGGFTAAAGHSLYTARNFPKEYWNRVAFVNEPTGRVVHRAFLKQNGAGFIEDGDGWNMLTSADEWAGPVQTEVGPDGAVWVVDWYDFIIQHNPTPSPQRGGYQAENGKGNAYINPLRDHERGRIYRIVNKENDARNTLSLNKNDSKGLISALSNNNMFWRLHAQRLLVENKDKTVLPELYKLVRNEKADEAGLNPAAIHALWTMHGLQVLDGTNKEAFDVATKALSHPIGGVRRAAIQVLPRTAATFQAIQRSKVLDDSDGRVKLAAILALTDMNGTPEVGEALVDVALKPENEKDNWLKYAITAAATKHQTHFAAAYAKKGAGTAASNIGSASFAQRLSVLNRITAIPLQARRFPGAAPLEAPDVINKEINITGELSKTRDLPYDGLIVAHGDIVNGYGLFMKENKLFFQVNQGGKQFVVNSEPLSSAAKVTFSASLLKEGAMTLSVNNKQVANTLASGLFSQTFKSGLRVGLEDKQGKDKVAEYPDTFRLRSQLAKGRLEVFTPGSPKSLAAAPKAAVAKTILMGVIKDVMKFDKAVITAKAGTVVSLVFRNPDHMQHNFVLIRPGTTEKVGAAADKLATDPNGTKLNYVPRMAEVLAATPLVNPGGKVTITFTVPDKPGDYPYVCTFPGHWRIMKGVMKVTK